MTSSSRLAWTEAPASGDGLLLVVDLRLLAGLMVALVIGAAPVVSAPLGRLSSPFALLVALPPLALALEAFGWRERLAIRLARNRTGPGPAASDVRGLATSAALTGLDG